MKERKYLNQRRLTVKQVQALATAEGLFRADYAKLFEKVDREGIVTGDLIFELPEGRFLYVYGPGHLWSGQGNIYAQDTFLQVLSHKRVYPNGQLDSESQWRAHSRYQAALVLHLSALEADLAQRLQLSVKQLDYSYSSLDLLSARCETIGLQTCVLELYDHLVAYVGAVLQRRVKGQWALNRTWSGGNYPFISIGYDEHIQYMVLNVVWQALSGFEAIDFQNCVLTEVRRQAPMVTRIQHRISQVEQTPD